MLLEISFVYIPMANRYLDSGTVAVYLSIISFSHINSVCFNPINHCRILFVSAYLSLRVYYI